MKNTLLVTLLTLVSTIVYTVMLRGQDSNKDFR